VENAIRHGIAPRIEPGRVEISAARGADDRFLHLEVRDNGPGNGPGQPGRTRKGVGLANIQSRLEQLYDGEHRFELENHPEGGVVVRISLPFRRGEGWRARRKGPPDDDPRRDRGRRAAGAPAHPHLLAEAEDVEVIAECANGREAIQAIEESPPDLLFLDIQMPELDGFDVLQAIGVGRVPVVIFVTAYDQFALRAFEAHALDYLLKPFDDERFEAALQRARERIRQQQGGDLDRRLRALLEEVRGDRGYLQRLVVPAATAASSSERRRSTGSRPSATTYVCTWGPNLPAAGEPEPHRVRAGSGEVLPDPPLHHREHRPHPGRRIALRRRVPGGASRWHEADLGAQLPSQPARPHGKGELSGTFVPLPDVVRTHGSAAGSILVDRSIRVPIFRREKAHRTRPCMPHSSRTASEMQ
jgi:CheY-like chemotaxis protein